MSGGWAGGWDLFGWSYVAALGAAVVLGFLGVVVVTRGQVFLAAAVAQASLLGLALDARWGWGQPMACAVVISGLAAMVMARSGRGRGVLGPEEAGGWLFLVCASLTPLVLAGQPVGLREIQALMSSSILGAEASDAVVMLVLAMMAVGVGMVAGRKLVLLVTDPTMAAAVGMGVGLWWTGLAVGVGLTTGLCLQQQGMLFTFGCLVLPPLVARNVSATTARMFWMSPLVGVVGTVAGLGVAHRVDLPPGQTIVALLGGTLVLVWGVRHLLSFLGRRSHSSAPPPASVRLAEGTNLSVEDSVKSLSGLAGSGTRLKTLLPSR